MLSPGALFNLPAGFPHLLADSVAFRYALLLLSALWAWFVFRGREGASFLAGVLFVELALGFRVFALGRPYGLLSDPEVTRRAAEIAVAASSPGSGLLVGLPPPASLAARVARLGVPAPLLVLLPTLMPLLVLPALAGLLYALVPRRRPALLSASLLLAFPTTEFEAVHGHGFVPGIWGHPLGALLVVGATAGVLALARVASGARWATPTATLVVLAAALVDSRPADDTSLAFAALLDPGPLLLLGVWGFRPGGSGAAPALFAGGLGGVLIAGLGGSDPWAALALFRLGLLTAAGHGLDEIGTWLAARLQSASPASAAKPQRLAGLLLLALLPGSFLARWNPDHLDLHAEASRKPLPSVLAPSVAWIRTNTTPGAALVVSPEYAQYMLVMAGRPLLRAPGLLWPADEVRRRAHEKAVLEGRPGRRVSDRHPLTHLVAIVGGGWPSGLELDRAPNLQRVYADRLVRIYRLASP